MNYLYHHVPRTMHGETLYPLNTLKSIYADVYEAEAAKYKGREHVPRQRIPLFGDCLWNDVLFLMAVNPQELFVERRKAGWPDLPPQRYFKIDPHTLDQSQLGIFLFQPWADPMNYVPENFTTYTYADLSRYASIPSETKAYFKHEFETGAPHIKLFYRYIPHILYHGDINIANVEIVTVR